MAIQPAKINFKEFRLKQDIQRILIYDKTISNSIFSEIKHINRETERQRQRRRESVYERERWSVCVNKRQ